MRTRSPWIRVRLPFARLRLPLPERRMRARPSFLWPRPSLSRSLGTVSARRAVDAAPPITSRAERPGFLRSYRGRVDDQPLRGEKAGAFMKNRAFAPVQLALRRISGLKARQMTAQGKRSAIVAVDPKTHQGTVVKNRFFARSRRRAGVTGAHELNRFRFTTCVRTSSSISCSGIGASDAAFSKSDSTFPEMPCSNS